MTNRPNTTDADDRLLLAEYVSRTYPPSRNYNARVLILRNGRWGTCVGCPRDVDGAHPEHCAYTDRYDHNIHRVNDGKFYHNTGGEIAREEILRVVEDKDTSCSG